MSNTKSHEEEMNKLRKAEIKWQRECQSLVSKLDIEVFLVLLELL